MVPAMTPAMKNLVEACVKSILTQVFGDKKGERLYVLLGEEIAENVIQITHAKGKELCEDKDFFDAFYNVVMSHLI